DGSQWYLRAWCHRVEGLRHFRLDRVLAAEVLTTPAAHPPERTGRTTEPELAEDDLLAELVLAPRARWLAERVPVVDHEDLPDGDLRVRLRVADPAWLTNVVLGLGPDVRAVAPPELAATIAARAADALAAYEDLSSSQCQGECRRTGCGGWIPITWRLAHSLGVVFGLTCMSCAGAGCEGPGRRDLIGAWHRPH